MRRVHRSAAEKRVPRPTVSAWTAFTSARARVASLLSRSRAPSLKLLAALPAGFTVDAVLDKLNLNSRKHVTPSDCAYACVAFMSRVATTPFQSYTCAGQFTMEFPSPHPAAPVLILLHGYGSGSGLWCFNVDDLARHFHVYAVDWLGCGASERPPFHAVTVAQGEDFFHDALHEWMRTQGLTAQAEGERRVVTAAGHSLGGYLLASYALKYDDLSHVVLVSPAGVPAPPDTPPAGGSATPSARDGSMVRTLLQWAWEGGVTPQSIVRALGARGEAWAHSVFTRRFARMVRDADHAAALSAYAYAITVADASGERALSVLLKFGAHAREPVGKRLLTAARDKTYATPTSFVYGGTHDWMDAAAGAATAAGLRAAGVDADCTLLPDSGHWLFMEQPQLFSQYVIQRAAQPRSVK